MRCHEAPELITGLVDGELTPEERRAIDAHLRECAQCAKRHEEEKRLQSEVRASAERVAAPAALRRAVEQRLAGAELPRIASRDGSYARWRARTRLQPWLAAALLLLAAAPVLYYFMRGGEIALAALSVHRELIDDAAIKSMPPVANMAGLKRKMTAAVGGRFAPVGFDLSAMNLYPVAAFTRQIAGRKTIVTVYRGSGRALTCFTLLGSEADAPAGALRFHDETKDVDFYSYSRDGMNAVLHREGDVLCILVSEMATDELLTLVRGKAGSA